MGKNKKYSQRNRETEDQQYTQHVEDENELVSIKKFNKCIKHHPQN